MGRESRPFGRHREGAGAAAVGVVGQAESGAGAREQGLFEPEASDAPVSFGHIGRGGRGARERRRSWPNQCRSSPAFLQAQRADAQTRAEGRLDGRAAERSVGGALTGSFC